MSFKKTTRPLRASSCLFVPSVVKPSFRMFPNPQGALPLPARPNLDQYRKLARSLLKACKAYPAKPGAIDHWAEQWVKRLAKGKKNAHITAFRINRWVNEVADFLERELILRGKKHCNLAGAQSV